MRCSTGQAAQDRGMKWHYPAWDRGIAWQYPARDIGVSWAYPQVQAGERLISVNHVRVTTVAA